MTQIDIMDANVSQGYDAKFAALPDGSFVVVWLARFIKKKSKVNNTCRKAWKSLMEIKLEHHHLFSHWYKISQPERRAV